MKLEKSENTEDRMVVNANWINTTMATRVWEFPARPRRVIPHCVNLCIHVGGESCENSMTLRFIVYPTSYAETRISGIVTMDSSLWSIHLDSESIEKVNPVYSDSIGSVKAL